MCYYIVSHEAAHDGDRNTAYKRTRGLLTTPLLDKGTCVEFLLLFPTLFLRSAHVKMGVEALVEPLK